MQGGVEWRGARNDRGCRFDRRGKTSVDASAKAFQAIVSYVAFNKRISLAMIVAGVLGIFLLRSICSSVSQIQSMANRLFSASSAATGSEAKQSA